MTNIAWGETEYYISIKAECFILCIARAGQWFKCYIEFPLHSLTTIKHTKFAHSDNKLHRIQTKLDLFQHLTVLSSAERAEKNLLKAFWFFATSVSGSISISWSIAVSALREIKRKVCGRDANKAWGKASCFIIIEAMCRVLYFA